MGPAAAADRRAVRPVRRARAGAVVVRHLRRRPVDPGRHAVRRDAGARGRRAPVDHHPVHRARAARLRHLRARVRARHRVVPAGRRWPGWAARTALGLPAAVHPAGRPGAGRGARPTRPPANAAAGRWSAGGLPAAPRRHAAAASPSPPWARSCPRRWPPPSGSTRLGVPADVVVRDQPRPAVPACGPAGCGEAPSWILDAAFPADRATPLVTVLDGHPHTLAFLAGVHRVPRPPPRA